jgi:hypothetical protein
LTLVENCKLTQDDLRVLYLFNLLCDEKKNSNNNNEPITTTLSAAPISAKNISDDKLLGVNNEKNRCDSFPFGKWINSWLQSTKRNSDFRNCLGPIFTMYSRALEKLPKTKITGGARSVLVKNNPLVFKTTIQHHRTRLKPGRIVCFWGFAPFLREDDDALLSKEFLGDWLEDEAIIYSCGNLSAVDVSPFTLAGSYAEKQRKRELLPLCPSVFQVLNVEIVEKKVNVTLRHLESQTEHFSYNKVILLKKKNKKNKQTNVDGKK